MMTTRVFCIAAAFGELGRGGWQFAGPWVADRPEIASAQAVATYMQQNPAVAQLPLVAITVSEVPVEAIRAWLDGIDKAADADKKAEAEKVVKWPSVLSVYQDRPEPRKEVVPHSEAGRTSSQSEHDKTEAPSSGGADPPDPAA